MTFQVQFFIQFVFTNEILKELLMKLRFRQWLYFEKKQGIVAREKAPKKP